MSELSKIYDPLIVEDRWYSYWEENKLFHGDASSKKKPFTIVIPPPNITGILTMGHVLNNTIQDLLIRWRKMQGYESCWVPGTDHAGIATQNVVEKSLAKKGLKRKEMKREDFVNEIWKWKDEYGGTIIKQLRKLGTACDWEREKFTLDPKLSEAVVEAFVHLYEKKLIYKGKYIVNWCPKDHTALSDDEVNFSEQQTNLWHIKYPIENSDETITIATTRPETMLGDTAVAVNPKDKRYKHLVGKNVLLPLVDRKIPIIADDYVEMEFGTGAVKITPAHDINDFQIAQRHSLPNIVVMNTSAMMNENVPTVYQGLDRIVCRKKVVADLENLGLLIKADAHQHSIGKCYRCETIIEPYLSDQWFVKMKPLSEQALKVVQNGEIKFYPEHWTKVYEHWMGNIRDWCISRQLWWGHRIPAWYCVSDEKCNLECRQPIVSRTKPEKCPYCDSKNLRQEEDVLDTWFSSWLWPLSVFGWPEKTNDLKYFYPTHTLVTGPDIIFFWVARMIMAGLEFKNEIPFKHVYFTSIIRDLQGKKMSKSLGNSPDPLEVISTYGADALRFTVTFISPIGQDVLYSNEKCELGRNFANKIWNAGRFLLMNRDAIGNSTQNLTIAPQNNSLELTDQWILSRCNETIKNISTALEEFKIDESAKLIYDFLWHDFCDWYVECIKIKIQLTSDINLQRSIINRALSIYETSLKLLHPIMPFITEELWQNIDSRNIGDSIMKQSWPLADEKYFQPLKEKEMLFIQKVVSEIRSIRNEMTIPPTKLLTLFINSHNKQKYNILEENKILIQKLARLETVTIGNNLQRPLQSASAVVEGEEIYIPLVGIIDLNKEQLRLEKEISRLQSQLNAVALKLKNKSFLDNAPDDVLNKEKEKEKNFYETIQKLQNSIKNLQ
ncbi:MAG: valine--tRNA ligase [Ignavibacteria bacterium]|nr:valine--tRNA ligase [Bacteroidota bacterium]MSQ46122.1 valine--tRNA ligase [Ignavibacteria bacterium]